MLAGQTLEARYTGTPVRTPAPAVRETGALEQRMAFAPLRKLESKEHVFCEGDPRIYVFRVEEGVVAIYKTLFDGRRRIIDFAYPGDLIGLGAFDSHIMGAQATCLSKVRCLSAQTLETMAQNDASLALKLYKSVCQELAATRSLLVTVGQRSAVERVAAFLITLHRRGDRVASNVIKLDMRRSDIADLLGLTIETISRTFAKLREMGVIDVEVGGTTVTLRDLDRLSSLANE